MIFSVVELILVLVPYYRFDVGMGTVFDNKYGKGRKAREKKLTQIQIQVHAQRDTRSRTIMTIHYVAMAKKDGKGFRIKASHSEDTEELKQNWEQVTTSVLALAVSPCPRLARACCLL